ncbi:protein phosphatase 2C domain-containing protein [Streptomyces monomycini]|uniref:protein phosphatase 2C domain-containing protein n=1 Tax=Streptomyces monomycini TaxID=371720 RepID=UPI001EECCC5F|nr:protein phosphatase 2C domain-containing protein [Streptomyces monomycini]
MNPQGDRRHHENSWWRELYEDHGEAARDTGPATAPDTLDDRVDSAFRAVSRAPGAGTATEDTTGAGPARETESGPAPGPPAAPAPGPEPMALPTADPAALDDLVPDTELDGAGYGPLTLRAASLRGEAARRRAEPRGDALLTARFGAGQHALILVAVATAAGGDGGAYAYAAGAHRAARDVCRWIGGAVGRSCPRLAEDIRTGDRCALKSGLHRLTDRSYGRLRAYAGEHGMDPEQYTAALRCLLLPADPACRTRVFFGVGAGGFLRLRNGAWQDLEPAPPRDDEAAAGADAAAAGQPDDGSAGGEPRAPEASGDTPPWPVPGDPATDAFHRGVQRPSDIRPDLRLPSDAGSDARLPSDAGADLRLPSDTRPDLRLLSEGPGPGPGPTPSSPVPGGTLPGLPRAPSGQHWRPPYESVPQTWPEPFRFRACVTRPGDALLLCSAGFAGPLTEAAGFAGRLAARWSGGGAPDLASFLADVRLHAEGYGQDRTAVAVWEGRDGAGAEEPE